MTALAIIPHQRIPVIRNTSAIQLAPFQRMDATSQVHFRPSLAVPSLGFFWFLAVVIWQMGFVMDKMENESHKRCFGQKGSAMNAK